MSSLPGLQPPALPAITAYGAADLFVLWQANVMKKATAAQLAAYMTIALDLGTAATATYASGTFTPVFQFLSAVTYVTQTGRYKRISGMVFWEIFMSWTGGDTADTSDLSIDLTPLTTIAALTNQGQGLAHINVVASTGLVLAAASAIRPTYNPTQNRLHFSDAAGVYIDYDDGQFQAAGNLMITGMYATADL